MGRRLPAIAALRDLARRRNLDVYAVRDVAIGFVLAEQRPAALAVLSRIRYRTALDRELTEQDPYLRGLQARRESNENAFPCLDIAGVRRRRCGVLV
jgi:hypothetical protein